MQERNASKKEFDFSEDKLLIMHKGLDHIAEDKPDGPFTVTQVHTNGILEQTSVKNHTIKPVQEKQWT